MWAMSRGRASVCPAPARSYCGGNFSRGVRRKSLVGAAAPAYLSRVSAMQQGSIRLFRFAGVQAYLHWSWFLVAVWEITRGTTRYSSVAWNVAEYVALFAIVLLHEFGHALACRQTGGRANEIVLWPLGGLAFVAPPPRAGATLWSIAAGPLVNVVLVPLLFAAQWAVRGLDAGDPGWEIRVLLYYVSWINAGLLIFNLLPVYPLDGGQILRAVLWFAFGRARSLRIATIVGFVGVAGLAGFALWQRSLWSGVIAVFLFQQCLGAYRHAGVLEKLAQAPRHPGFACPACGAAPVAGATRLCHLCRKPFDPFTPPGRCPHCGAPNLAAQCLDCGEEHTLEAWSSTMPTSLRN